MCVFCIVWPPSYFDNKNYLMLNFRKNGQTILNIQVSLQEVVKQVLKV